MAIRREGGKDNLRGGEAARTSPYDQLAIRGLETAFTPS
jgi:hypothetical protein